jgi:hypothetical protein
MTAEPRGWIHNALSSARFARYLKAADGNWEVAVRLYRWNIDVSSAFYGPLHWLEVSLRNALNDGLRARYERADWWVLAPLDDNGHRKIVHARRKLARRSGPDIGADSVVAELSFGFWVSLLSKGKAYDRVFWVPVLHKAFPHYSGPRQPLHTELTRMLRLRNRIMHHEPIFDHDLAAYREGIYRHIGYLSPIVADQVRQLDRTSEALARRDAIWDGESPSDSAEDQV